MPVPPGSTDWRATGLLLIAFVRRQRLDALVGSTGVLGVEAVPPPHSASGEVIERDLSPVGREDAKAVEPEPQVQMTLSPS